LLELQGLILSAQQALGEAAEENRNLKHQLGQVRIVVRGQDVGCCGFGSWQFDLLDVLECDPREHAIAGQTVAMLTSINAIIHATAFLIIGVDVPNRILVVNILRAPKDQHTKERSHCQPG
jgi:hypothetical protein